MAAVFHNQTTLFYNQPNKQLHDENEKGRATTRNQAIETWWSTSPLPGNAGVFGKRALFDQVSAILYTNSEEAWEEKKVSKKWQKLAKSAKPKIPMPTLSKFFFLLRKFIVCHFVFMVIEL